MSNPQKPGDIGLKDLMRYPQSTTVDLIRRRVDGVVRRQRWAGDPKGVLHLATLRPVALLRLQADE